VDAANSDGGQRAAGRSLRYRSCNTVNMKEAIKTTPPKMAAAKNTVSMTRPLSRTTHRLNSTPGAGGGSARAETRKQTATPQEISGRSRVLD
jgi:hypothetical protein